MENLNRHMDIAVIGVGLKIAGATTLREYWSIFDNNIDCIRELPEHRKEKLSEFAKVFLGDTQKPEYYRGTYLENIDEFDYEFFKISPREAQVMDPQHRLLLETICETFDDAGYSAKALKGSKTGVFIGQSSASFKDNYLMDIMFTHPEMMKYAMTGNITAILPARAAHVLDLKGPCMVIDTACSSSLVSINEACDSLKNHTSEMAIAGGVKINLLPLIAQDTKLGFESSDDKTRTFDIGANGTSIGEGVACVLLKPLKEAEKDHDFIYGVIKGISINHDGTAMGITAPNPVAQTNVIIDALDDAEMSPEDIDYIEAHGTATILGDPIELQGLINAYGSRTSKKQFCGLSASKSNLGHLYEAASIAAFLKAIAALKYKKVPGMKNFFQPNIMINFCNSPFYVNHVTRDWEAKNGKLRTCAVSSFGISGTNCHLILQEYESPKYSEAERPTDILCLSAKSGESIQTLLSSYIGYLKEQNTSLNKVSFNTNANRTHYQHRLCVVYSNKAELIRKLKKATALIGLENSVSDDGIYYSNLLKAASAGFNAGLCTELVQDCNEMFLAGKNEGGSDGLKQEILGMLGRIAINYIGGADIDWGTLYNGFCRDKIPLPYYPFKKMHMWIPTEKAESAKEVKTVSEENTVKEGQLFYQRVFIKKDEMPYSGGVQDCLLVKLSKSGSFALEKTLEAKFRNVNTVVIDENMLKVMSPATYFVRLFKGVDFSAVSHIVFPWFSFQDAVKSAPELKDFERVTLLGLVSLYKCLTSSIWKKNNIKIVNLIKNTFSITGEEPSLRPEGASLFGFCKALSREFGNFHSLCIDFDEAADAQKIIEEICADHLLDIVCYRGLGRYVEGLKEAEIPSLQASTVLKDGGIYLVTGGLGGIGFETAMEILRRTKDVTLIIMNRSSLPEQSLWDSILRERKDEKLAKRIDRITLLTKYAKAVEYIPCDISDISAVEAAVSNINQKYGKIDGVFHAAGIGGGAPLAKLDEERVMGMISPKIFGAYALDHATRSQRLDFFVMFSSISTIFSSSDLADYIAGNLYLDAYCESRKREQPGISMTVNWATWSQTGMSVEHNFTIDTLFKSIQTKTGVEALFSALEHGSGNIVIGELNLNSQIGLLIKKYRVELSPFIQEKVKRLEDAQKKEKEEAALRPKSESGSYGLVERQLCGVCCKVLGYEDINIFDNFFELGADSILLGHIFNEVDSLYSKLLSVTDLFSHPTVKTLSEYILELGGVPLGENAISEEETPEAEKTPQAAAVVENTPSSGLAVEAPGKGDIAIIGVGMNLPNAGTLDEYWQLLVNGINAIREMPEEHRREVEQHIKSLNKVQDSSNVTNAIKFRKCAYLDDLNTFDYSYFGMSPREASIIDPAHRLFLQCCASAIDDSGYGRNGIMGTNTGVILGYSANIGSAYSRLLYEADSELFSASLPVNQISMAASKIAYLYDLRGPSMVVDTACSSSLMAIHLACSQIRDGNCDMVLAGGVSLALSPMADKFKVGFESQEEKTRAFADGATGSAIGEGVGVVLLKPLKKAIEDNDAIYAVIKGSAVNQDGKSFGMAAPNYLAQSEAITQAWKNANIGPDDISYIEAHGTGTPLGDPIEVKGITHAYRTLTDKKQMCGFGSLKTNIGHLNEASGISGIFKLILMLNNRIVPPILNFNTPNKNIDFLASPLYVVTRPTALVPKPGRKRTVVGINGFGMSGTNCHMVLEEAPQAPDARKTGNREPYLFTISAKSTGALKRLLLLYCSFVKNNSVDFGNLCYNINVSRFHFQYRLAFCFNDKADLLNKLKDLSANYPYEVSDENCYIGQYAIVPENKTNKYDYEITLKEMTELSEKAENLVGEYLENGSQNLLFSIMQLYVKGAEIVWAKLYNGVYTKMHLPTYPYDKYHCWYKVPEPEAPAIEPSGLDSYYYEKVWARSEAQADNRLKPGDVVVLFRDGEGRTSGLSAELKNQGLDVIDIFSADSFAQTENGGYFVQQTIEGYQKLFEEFAGKDVKALIHAKSLFAQPSRSGDEISAKLEESFFNLVNIIKAMSKAHFNNKTQLIIIANNAYAVCGGEEFLIPENASILSIGKVVEQEYPNIECRAIDIDFGTSAEAIAKEVIADVNLYMTGLRNNERFIEKTDEAEINVENENILKEGGVYVVTGGTDGIGLETACHISRQINGHIILLSRRGFSKEEEWPALRSDEKAQHKIERFEAIKANGCSLDIDCCDVGDYNSVNKALCAVRAKYGRINGIVHSAGISGAGYILRKERESFLAVFNPKIFGAFNLDTLTVEDKLDFLLLFSSAVTDSGEAGQSDYVAANSYLDAFTDYRNKIGRKTLTVNWVSWKETGMSVVHGINTDSVTKAITTKEGIAALDEFIKSSKRRVTIGQFNVDRNFFEMSRYSKNKVSSALEIKIAALREKYFREENPDTRFLSDGNRNYAEIKNGKLIFIPKSDKAAKSLKVSDTIKLTGDYTNNYGQTEKVIGSIYSAILGYDEINVFDNFFEMGGDSVMLLEMHGMIDEKYPESLSVADLFEYTSVRTLSEYIDSKTLKKPDEALREVAAQAVANPEADTYDLSVAQRRVYADCRLNMDKLLYNNPFLSDISEFEGDLEEVLKKIVVRHEILRTSFINSGKKLMQHVMPEVKVKVDYVQVPDIKKIDYHLYLKEFDFKNPPLFHATVFLGPKNKKILLFDVHHILFDGYSASLFQNMLLEIAHGNIPEGPTDQYRDYVRFEADFMQSEAYHQMERYWADRLNGYDSVISLSPTEQTMGYGTLLRDMDDEFSRKLKELSSSMNISFFCVLYAALNLALSKEFDKNDIVMLVPVLNRYRPQFKKILGLFINLLPIRGKMVDNAVIPDYLNATAKNIGLDISNQFCDFSSIIQIYNKENNVKNPKFYFFFDYEDRSIKKIKGTREMSVSINTSKYGIDFYIRNYNNSFQIEASYKANFFRKEQVENILNNFNKCLRGFVTTDDACGSVKLLKDSLSSLPAGASRDSEENAKTIG